MNGRFRALVSGEIDPLLPFRKIGSSHSSYEHRNRTRSLELQRGILP